MGEDRFTKDILPRAPVEGTLVMIVKLLFNFDATVAPKLNTILPALRTKVRSDHGDKFFAFGKARPGTAQEWEFKHCLIRLQPRFLVQNLRPTAAGQPQADFDNLPANVGAHFTVNVRHSTTPVTRWQAAAPNRVLLLEADATTAGFLLSLQNAF